MKINMKIKIRKVRFAEFLILFELALIFFAGPISMINPSAYNITFLIDIINIFLFIVLIKDKKNNSINNYFFNRIKKYMIFIILLTFLSSFFRAKSPLIYLWSFRRFIGYFIYFCACVKYCKLNYIKMFKILYWINFLMVLFEFLVLKKSQDWIGGMFGIIGGTANAPLILFLSISTILFFVLYFNKKLKVSYLLLTSICSMIVASIGELKFFYFLFIIILILSVLMTKFSYKKLIAIVGSIFIIILGISLLYKVFPNFDRNYFTLDFFMGTYASKHGYTGTHDVNRLYFIPMLNIYFSNTFETLFGLGLGNCSYISISKIYSNFYLNHISLHYDWFSSTLLFIETGYIGFILFFGLFIYSSIMIGKNKKNNESDIIYSEIGQILALIVPLFLLYNNCMFQAEGYLVYFILSLSFINRNNCQLGVSKGE